MTTESIVRKCFCPSTSDDGFVNMLYGIVSKRSDVMRLARAARRFVRLENREKAEREWSRFIKSCKGKHKYDMKKGSK